MSKPRIDEKALYNNFSQLITPEDKKAWEAKQAIKHNWDKINFIVSAPNIMGSDKYKCSPWGLASGVKSLVREGATVPEGVTEFIHTRDGKTSRHLLFSAVSDGGEPDHQKEYKKFISTIDLLFINGDHKQERAKFYFPFEKPVQNGTQIDTYKFTQNASSHITTIKHTRGWPDYDVLNFDAETVGEYVRGHLDALTEGKVVGIHCRGGAGRTGVLEFAYHLFDEYEDFFSDVQKDGFGQINLEKAIRKLQELRLDRPNLVQSGEQLRLALLLAQQMKFIEIHPYPTNGVSDEKERFEKGFQEYTEKCRVQLDNAASIYVKGPGRAHVIVELISGVAKPEHIRNSILRPLPTDPKEALAVLEKVYAIIYEKDPYSGEGKERLFKSRFKLPFLKANTEVSGQERSAKERTYIKILKEIYLEKLKELKGKGGVSPEQLEKLVNESKLIKFNRSYYKMFAREQTRSEKEAIEIIRPRQAK